jgi:hypothetical protein
MSSGAWRGAVALARGRPEPAMGWTCARGKRLQGCGSYGDYIAVVATATGGRRRANVVKHRPDVLYL